MHPTLTQARHRTARASAARPWALLCLLAALLAAGCAELPLPQASPPPSDPVLEQSSAELSAQAEGFWKAGNHPQSELLYSRLLERADLSQEARLQALDRLAESACRARHYHQAKQALDRRASLDKTVLATWPWHELYIKTLAGLARPELLDTHLAWITAHTELPFALRGQAALAFADIFTQSGDAARALALLAQLHRQAPDDDARARLEAAYAASLRELSQDSLAALLRQSGAERSAFFPQALVQREAARRGLSRSALAAPAAQAHSAAPLPVLLAQAGQRVASDQPQGLLPRQDGGVAHVALALPLTGRFAATGQKVLRGAAAAQKRLAAQGRRVELKIINADAADWREQLAALPPSFAAVGGPLLNPEALRALEAEGALSRRAVFAFLADLGGIQEGRQAWRFYPSLKDQAGSLLDLTADRLGIRSVAVLSPKNRYGERMAAVFQAEAKARNLRVSASETYPPEDHPRWLHSVSRLLKIPEGFRRNKNMPLPMPDFGAVFLPEDWTQAELLASNFHFFEGQHLLFLGPDLWSVGLDNARDPDDTSFQHAVCPGAWWPETAGARALQALLDEQSQGPADFWTALGFDFVRLAARLNLGADWTATEVNMRLAAVKDLDYSMAPLSWNADGQARQALYLFSPRREGKALVDAEALREALKKARDRRERRLALSREMHKKGASGSLTRDVAD